MEIGSEFYKIEKRTKDQKFFISGRTALEYIIRDVLSSQKINLVHMPSYCCHTMIEPFIRHGLEIRFYDAYHEDGILKAVIPEANQGEIFFYIKYFGYENQQMGNLKKIKEGGCIIIEDATHSWLQEGNVARDHSLVDYRFVSYRKWTGFTGISTGEKYASRFEIPQMPVEHVSYDLFRKSARKKKKQFLEFGKGEKQEFLDEYGRAEELLENDYVDYIPSRASLEAFIGLDKDMLKTARRRNAQILLEAISDLDDVTPIFNRLSENDVPLNVPILVDEAIRDDFRKYLISKQIYCPVHWPLSDLHEGISEQAKEIYRRELSLVCDQRYSIDDMKRFVECIKDYFEKRL